MLYDVTAISVDPTTGEPTPPRTERIDTDTNQIFDGCDGLWDVEDRYQLFWNRLNESWEHSFPEGKNKVFVLSVQQVAA